MADATLKRLEEELEKIRQDLWDVDSSDDALDKVLAKITSLKAQFEVQKSLQVTANLLRRQPKDRALPKQQATKVKHLIRFVFRKDSRGGDRSQQLRQLDCDSLKLCGLTYTTEDIVKMEHEKFELVRTLAAEFMLNRQLSPLLYRPDVDKAVDAVVEEPDDQESKYNAFASPNEDHQGGYNGGRTIDNIDAPANSELHDAANQGTTERATSNKYKGGVFIVRKEDARYAMSLDQHIWEIWLTNPEQRYNTYDGKKRSFLTLWVSEEMGKELGKRGKLMVANEDTNGYLQT
ncbi:hypothetical protein H634G_10874 [Metarhizium anisopliae BRIP 53293]|uniref:Uncharacterized protein n=1 Tax=Metarhizium anisopliae BRIP 53293 TaxID=1291518 RepID=A0A0D9NJD1_METAN|nr:hypothetical protein H634G_10874 [Metarhizium anisopliae BRIP 53293]KJK88376.1 hypothetical protein H633G_07766 [Metarhizium anisopliae BRIP 53284]